MVKNKTTAAKKSQKPVLVKISPVTQWIFAVSSILIIPVIYYEEVIDQVLMPRFTALAVMLFLFYLFFLLRPKYNLPDTGLLKSGIVISWILYAFISIISLINAVNPVEGLFDISKTFLFLFFLLAAAGIFSHSWNTRPYVVSAGILALIYIVIGYYQYFAYAFGHSDLAALYKVIGIWTHKNFFSGMLYLLLPLFFYKILTEKKERLAFTILMFFILTLLFLLQTRSVWLGVIMLVVSAASLMFIFRKSIFTSENKVQFTRASVMVISAVILSVAVAWIVTSISLKSNLYKGKEETSGKERNISGIDQRVATMFDTRESNIRHRIDMWHMSLEMFREHPFLGVGSGNWKIDVADYLTEKYNAGYFNNIRRPHNDFLWILCEKGIPGLLAYLAFFVFLLVYAIKLLKKQVSPQNKILVILCLSGIAGYFMDSSLSFPYERIEHQIMVMFYVSVILAMYYAHFPFKINPAKLKPRVFNLFALIILAIAIYFGKTWIKEEFYIDKAYSAHFNSDWNKTIRLIDKATSPIEQLDPRNTPPLWFRGKSYLMLNEDDKAFADLDKAYRQNPNSILVLVDLGVVYGKKGNYEKSIALLKKSLVIYPKFRDGLTNLATAYYLSGRYQEALECYNKVLTVWPTPDIEKIVKYIREKKLKKP